MQYVKRFIRQDKDYFRNNQADIHQQNSLVLRFACAIYMVVLAVYTLIAISFSQSQTLINLYYIFDAIHVLLCLLVYLSAPGKRNDPFFMNYCRIFLELTILSFFILEAVFPYPSQHSIYFPFPIILLVMLFIYSVRQALLMILSYIGVFLVLVFLFKTGDARINDVYLASGTLISALVGYVIVASLRHETGEGMRRLRYLSMTDALTGLYNKQTFESLCRAFLEDGSRRGYALLFIDIDRFKQINDRYGHQAGDSVLTRVGGIMRETFYGKDYLCRFGGDEFVVFMIDVDSKSDVNERVSVFQSRVRGLSGALGIDELSCSVGVAMKGKMRETYAELLSRADAALYVLKKKGADEVGFAEQYGALDGYAAEAPDVPAQPDGETPRRRVLIVDDNEVNRQVLHKILSFGYETIEAENGLSALTVLEREGADISAVLLDIVMPVMDGYELLIRMRADEALKNIPVIVTTGIGDEEAEVKSLSLGANDFIVKPYRPVIILHRLGNVINLRETAAMNNIVKPD